MSSLFGATPLGSSVQTCQQQQEQPPVYWIEIQLLGEDDGPVPWERYTAVLPDGTRVEGFLDHEGLARIDQIPTAGDCLVSFPDLDKEAWQRIGT